MKILYLFYLFYSEFLAEGLLQPYCSLVPLRTVSFYQRYAFFSKYLDSLHYFNWKTVDIVIYSSFLICKILLFLKHRRVLGITVSWLQMQNAFKPTFSPKGVKNMCPGLYQFAFVFASPICLCLQPNSLSLTCTSLQRTKSGKAFPPRCLLSMEAFAQVLQELLLVVFERAGAMGLFPQKLLVYPSWMAAIADIFQLCLTHSRWWDFFQQCQNLAKSSLY